MTLNISQIGRRALFAAAIIMAGVAHAETSAPEHRIIIDAQGDSTMYGYQTSDGFKKTWQTPDNPPALLQAALQARFGPRVIVQNNGVPGATLVDRQQGVNGYRQSYAQWVAASPAHIVIVNFALNDADNHDKEPPDVFRSNLIGFIEASQHAGRIVVLEEPSPVDYAANKAIVPQYVAVVDDLAQQYGLALVRQYRYIEALPDWRALLIDGVHPTDRLYRIKAEREREVVEPIVAKLVG
jgi:acyl-CoA thioesterase I